MTPYLQSAHLENISGISHGFFTRQGGVSKGDFATLNAGLSNGDQHDHVMENRRRISRSLGFHEKNLLIVRQIHSPTVLIVNHPFEETPPEADALITTTPGLLIGVLTADCVPVLLSTSTGDIVAAVHAGWRGAVHGILENTIQQMRALGAHHIKAALGPCIWQDSYEVSQEFYENLKDTPCFFKTGHRPLHWQFDLPGYVMARLQKAGIQDIDSSPANTYAHPDRFFSYRRKTIMQESQFGNSLSSIGIRKSS